MKRAGQAVRDLSGSNPKLPTMEARPTLLEAEQSYLCQNSPTITRRQLFAAHALSRFRISANTLLGSPLKAPTIRSNSNVNPPPASLIVRQAHAPAKRRTPAEVDLPGSPATLVSPGGSTWVAYSCLPERVEGLCGRVHTLLIELSVAALGRKLQ